MTTDFDVCIIGSGAGAGPVALTLAKAGHSVVVLEKGPWYTEQDFYKDELTCCRRSVFTPKLWEEQHVIEDKNSEGDWQAEATFDSGWDFWNGNCVGGSSNFMSGFFHRLKPEDFRLLSTFGPIDGANIADWPISYADLEPYYTKVETEVGVSGRVVDHPHAEPRSSADFPYPATAEHPVAGWIDRSCDQLGLHSIPVPRAILPHAVRDRNGCSYSNYCGSYGCSTGAKGSSRAALIARALKTGHCEIRPHSKVHRLHSDHQGRVVLAQYFDKQGNSRRVDARIFVVACQAIETARLLLASSGKKHPQGLANGHGQVGRNLIFSAGGSGTGDLLYRNFPPESVEELKVRGPFVNRALQDWYVIDDREFGGRVKGGTIDFLFRHPNAISRANSQKWDNDGRLIWGEPLKRQLHSYFTGGRYLQFEIFCDWTPVDDCFVTLDPGVRDKWGSAVAKIRIGYHRHDLRIGRYLADRAERVLTETGCEHVRSRVSGSPPPNLVAGGCRFGRDPKSSVLDADCRAHDAENLFVSDGSFMPTGGSVPYTWTIYANAFRVADKILQQLGTAEIS